MFLLRGQSLSGCRSLEVATCEDDREVQNGWAVESAGLACLAKLGSTT